MGWDDPNTANCPELCTQNVLITRMKKQAYNDFKAKKYTTKKEKCMIIIIR